MIITPNRFYMSSVQNANAQTNGTTNFTDITGLAIPMSAADQLTFRFMVIFQQSNALDSIKIQFTAPAAPVVFAYDHHIFNASSINAPLLGTTVPSPDTPYISWTQGYIENGPTEGDLQMQFAAVSGLGTVTVLKNCNAVSWRVFP